MSAPGKGEPSVANTVGIGGGWYLDPGDVGQVGKQAQVVRTSSFSRVAINLHFDVVSQFLKTLETLSDF